MIAQGTLLVQLIRLIARIPTSQPPPRRRRGRPVFYSERLFLKALVIMIIRRLHRVSELLSVLGDTHYNNAENVREACWRTRRFLVASKRGYHPHTDDGVEVVRRIFHKLRSVANENFNEHFKSIFEVHGQVPTKGETNTARFALGAVFVYQLANPMCKFP